MYHGGRWGGVERLSSIWTHMSTDSYNDQTESWKKRKKKKKKDSGKRSIVIEKIVYRAVNQDHKPKSSL